MSLATAWDAYVALAAREAEGHALHPARYPHHGGDDGRWHRLPVDRISRWADDTFYDHGNWTAGFAAGVAWLRTLQPGEPSPGEPIRDLLRGLEQRAADGTTHDLGFLFYPSYVMGAVAGGLAGEELDPARAAAGTLASRFRPEGGYLQAFGALDDPRSAGTSTIDTMMNLPLLWWAGGDGAPELFELARRHARTSADVFFRDDDSTYHLVRFDPASGELVQRGTFQGAGSDSCWSRGQAWAIAGFALAFAATGDDDLLAASERAWRYFAARIPDDGVVPWDFTDDSPEAPDDASASAAAALGAVVLGAVHPSAARRAEFAGEGASLLEALAVSAVGVEGEEGILQRSCYSRPHRLGVRGPTPWGDFFYGLALAIATGRTTIEDLLRGSVPAKEAIR
jgi:unsaturated chondroitin disaccharide hydrolase